MNLKLNNKCIKILAAFVLTALGSQGCSVLGSGDSRLSGGVNAQSSNAQASASTSVPSADAVAGRIQKALTTVSPASGNFSVALADFSTSLSQVTDPNKATGLDKIPLIVYAACTDVNPSTYSVNVNGSISSNAANLVAAGLAMVNAHVGNLAASGTGLNSQVSTVFSNLVSADSASGATTAMTFVSVCLAANSFGVGMLGF